MSDHQKGRRTAKDSVRRREQGQRRAPSDNQRHLDPKPQRPTRQRDDEVNISQPITFTPEAQALVSQFAASQPFPLDPFQIEAASHLAEGRSVLVAAPTGTGKTVVAEFGIWQARRAGLRAIYTAPLKALSNQKFRDLRQRYGEREVGLLTGDIVENPRAPIVVMTTEIYRNMLLEGLRVAHLPAVPEDTPAEEAETLLAGITRRTARAISSSGVNTEEGEQVIAADDVAELARRTALDEELSTVGCVIFDELHYLADPGRGPVWEEAIIHSPERVTLIGLSATVSNADELRRWIEHVHGPTSLVFHTERSVPLEHYFFLDGHLHLVQNAAGERVERFPNIGGEAKLARMRGRFRRYTTYSEDEDEDEGNGNSSNVTPAAPADERPTRAARRAEHERALQEQATQTIANGEQPKQQSSTPTEAAQPKERQAPEAGETLTALRDAELLPCIYFLPGRRAVEVAAESAKSHLLVTPEERARLQAEVQAWVERLPNEDQKLEQVQRLAALLPRGLAFHHAGLLPGLKVMVETLFQRGDLRAVFATDTLALGVNMPARSVVLGSLSKFDGVQMRLMTPNEYQQLTGRAGRRGMDAKGAAIIPYSPWDAFEPAFAALTAPLLPVNSAFTIRYNTVLNLWRANDPDRLRIALAASLREFQRRGGPARSSQQAAIEYDLEPTPGASARRRARQHRNPHALSRAAAAELNGTISVLRSLRYIGEDDELTVKGRLLRALFHPAGVVLTELLVSGALDGLTAPELAEAISWFTFDDDRSLRNTDYLSQRLIQLRREVGTVRKRVATKEYEEGLAISPGIIENFHGVALNWHRGFSLGGLLRRIDLAEGDLLVILNQTIDLLQQLQGAVGQTLDADDLWQEATDETRYGRYLVETRARLGRLRPLLDGAWRGMLRGSVAQSRAIPSMSTPIPSPTEPPIPLTIAAPIDGLMPPLPMAEDQEPDLARQDRVEEA